jgi:hypothetical protein
MSTPALIFFQADTLARPPRLLQNRAHVETLPFDGLVINIPASYTVSRASTRLDYADTRRWLTLDGMYSKLNQSYLLAYTAHEESPPDVFDSQERLITNWRLLARAAREAGMRGLFVDNEPYDTRALEFPDGARWPEFGLARYQRQARSVGRWVMDGILKEWPEAHVIVAHGPYVSEPKTPREVSLLQVETTPYDLRGHWFSGMAQASGNGQLVDGGEVYQYRTREDFVRSRQWRETGLPQVPSSTVVPSPLRRTWRDRVSIGFGVYDRPWKAGYEMNPEVLETTLTNALAVAEDVVWLYTDGSGGGRYLDPLTVDSAYVDVVRRARGAG